MCETRLALSPTQQIGLRVSLVWDNFTHLVNHRKRLLTRQAAEFEPRPSTCTALIGELLNRSVTKPLDVKIAKRLMKFLSYDVDHIVQLLAWLIED